MIIKFLIDLIKKNKMQLDSKNTAWKLNIGLVTELLLGVIWTSIGLNMTLDYFVFHRVETLNIFGLIILLYGISNMKILFDLFIRSKGTNNWEWKEEFSPKYYTTSKVLKRKDGYAISFRPKTSDEFIYSIEKNGIIHYSDRIKTVEIKTSESMKYVEVKQLVDFIIEKQSFPYTEIEEIDRTYQLVSPYIKETIEKREASVIVTLPDDFVEELKAFVHKEDKKEPLQHIVN